MSIDANKRMESPLAPVGRRAGIGLHVSALPGDHGIGDIADSGPWFVDRLAEMEIGVWQFLPLGPTAYGDSPYQPLSAFAGNAMLIGLNPLIREGLLNPADAEILAGLPRDFTDYGRLIPAKRALLRKAARRFASRRGNGLVGAYEDFLHRHAERWLDDYALFRVLKTLHGERAWPEWDKVYKRRNPSVLQRLRDEQREGLDYVRFTQFQFERQWSGLKAYAENLGIKLFGDMPIYIALDSADAWARPQMLLIDRDGRPSHVAGVPPDYFSEDGQLWGNPLYDWEYHRSSGYRWWIERTRHAMRQMHLVRIDHFRGFEAFWSVPHGADTAKKGQWIPGPGDALFEALEAALGKLPIVAEDLGVITPGVEELRRKHGIPGMVVLQFEVGQPGFDVDEIEENCVCYTGTHDNDTTLGWFRGNGDDTRSEKEIVETRRNALRATSGASETIHADMIRLALSSPAALAIAPMQDLLGLSSEARFNRPGTTRDNWRWRMQAGQLSPELMAEVRDLVRQTSRGPT